MLIAMRILGIVWILAVSLGITVYMSLLENNPYGPRPSIEVWFFALGLLVVGCLPAWCLLGTQPLRKRKRGRKRKPRAKTW
jgi:type VI protein secretion system component VasK